MMARPVHPAGDVLVIGAGATGLLTALELVRRGYACTLVDRVGVAAAQSNHSHGYLHSGYIYLRGGERLTDALRAGSRAWRAFLTAASVRPTTSQSTIAFGTRAEAHAARAYWSALGLPVQRARMPEGIVVGGDQAAFRTLEPAFDFTGMWFALAHRLCQVPQIRATVDQLRVRDRRTVEGVDATLVGDGRPVRLTARAYVVAAGADNPGLMRAAVRTRGRAIARMSHMLVASGPQLPPLSLILPGADHYGLFVVSRPREGGGNHWLISNHLSFAYDGHTETGTRLWLNATLRHLGRLAPVLRDPEVRWGVYPAPKGEFRDLPGAMQSHSVETYELDNLVALSPTKLTLVPLLAGEAARHVASLAGEPSGTPAPAPPAGAARLQVQPETWRSLELTSLTELVRRHDCRRAAQHVAPPTAWAAPQRRKRRAAEAG